MEGPGCTSKRMILDPQHMRKKPGVPATPGVRAGDKRAAAACCSIVYPTHSKFRETLSSE